MQQNRDNIYCGLTKIFFNCQAHPDEIANMIIYNDQTEVRTIICSNCLALMPSQSKEVKPFKMALLQIHKTCKKLMTDVTLAAFVDHHLNLIRGIVRNHFKQIQPLLQSSVTNWFSKYRELINGKYFNEFYGAGSEILSIVNKNKNSQDHSVEKFKRLKRLMNFIDGFYKKITVLEDYQKMTLEQVMSGQNLLKKIKTEVGDIYKQFKEKAPTAKNWNQEEVLQIFNPSVETTKFYRFSQTLLHSTLKIVDPKVVTMPNLPESQYTVLSLIQPSIGNKKRSIKLRMNGIKAWVAVGIAIKSKVEANCYKFQSTNHGTFQISYDGYSWGQDSSVNEQYTSWYFNQNDILTLTVNPSAGELVFVKNDELTKPYTLKFKHQKKDKLYFCVSVNYHQDSVSIVE